MRIYDVKVLLCLWTSMLLLNKTLFTECYSETYTDITERSLSFALHVLIRDIH